MSKKPVNGYKVAFFSVFTISLVFVLAKLTNSWINWYHLPKYKVGDCLESPGIKHYALEYGLEHVKCERWEHCEILHRKILEVGEEHYRVVIAESMDDKYENTSEFTELFRFTELANKKVQCPKELERY